jgi:MFS family permease
MFRTCELSGLRHLPDDRAGPPARYRCQVVALFADVSPLRHSRDFRRLWTGQTISAMGSQLTLVALAYQTFHLTHSTFMVGLLGFVGLVPLLAGSLWGGTLADAWDRKRMLTLTQFAMAIAVGGLAVNAALDHPEVWVLFVCAAASAGFQGMDWPARRAALPMLVSDEDVTAAVTLQTTTMALSTVVGPAVGGVLIARLGLTPVYLIDVATYAVSLSVLLLPRLVPSGGGTPMGLRSMAEGFRHLKGERLLSATYLIDLNAMIFGMPRAVFPALAVHLYGGGAGVVGLLYAAPGAGALVGSLVTGWTSRIRHQGRAIAACVVVWGGTIAVFGVVPVPWVGLALLAVAGAADVISAVFRQNVQQRAVPDHLQGRLSGTFFAVVAGGPRLGDLETGVAAAIGGPEFAVWSGGLACVVGVGILLWRVPELWADDGGGRPISAADREEAVAEAISELNEGEPL